MTDIVAKPDIGTVSYPRQEMKSPSLPGAVASE